MELSDADIDRFFAGLNQYGGCLSRDELRKVKPNTKKFYIINLDRADGQGTHWCLLSFLNPKVAQYFDPFGEPPPEAADRLMRKLRLDSVYSTIDVQSLNSVMCGYFAVWTACQLLNGKPFADIIRSFSSKTSTNEKMMHAFAKQAFSWKF